MAHAMEAIESGAGPLAVFINDPGPRGFTPI
jgi:hypothetical protein